MVRPPNKKPSVQLQRTANSRVEHRGVLITLAVLLALSAAVIASVFVFTHRYAGRFFPGTTIGSVAVGGLTYDVARQRLQAAANAVVDGGVTLSYADQRFTIPTVSGDLANPELASPLFAIDVEATLAAVQAASAQQSEADHVFYWLVGWQVAAVVDVDEAQLLEALHGQLSQFEQPAEEAKLAIAKDGSLSITPEKSGQAFSYPTIMETIHTRAAGLMPAMVTVQLSPDYPVITQLNAQPALDVAEQILLSAPYTFRYGDRTWSITPEQVRQWLSFMVGPDGAVTVGLAHAEFSDWLTTVAAEVNVPVQEAKFTMADGRVTEFQPSQTGVEMDEAATEQRINEKIRQVGIREIDLVVTESKPTITTNTLNDYGIVELIGEGHSNFKGSPKNRRHNIALGATTLNGLLIKPGEEFSLVKALGKIEASTGYLPELVIKGNKTTPEFGGGLCQIGTTTFRAALDAGLPIVERKNHSYRVSYYEPAGTDATIYDPKPDFRFLNDTGNYILFTTEIQGDDLYFRFYGTRDGRTVEQTKPRIFNQVKPGPTKLIETTDLKPGEKKCTEKAHVGADAEFTRTVTLANGEKKVDTFRSHYKPWQEVCLIGVAAAAPAPAAVE